MQFLWLLMTSVLPLFVAYVKGSIKPINCPPLINNWKDSEETAF